MNQTGGDSFSHLEPRVKSLREALAQIAELAGVELSLAAASDAAHTGECAAQILVGGVPTNWRVVSPRGGAHTQAKARTAAQVLGALLTAENDIQSMATEIASRYEEANFLYEMSERVGALLDEQKVCEFVVERAAQMLECARASLMLFSQEDQALRIVAAVGLPENMVRDTLVQPGHSISGKVYQSGHPIIVDTNDPLPPEALRTKALESSDSFLSIPLKVPQDGGAEEVVGVVNMTRKLGSRMFTSSDLKLISAVAVQTATQIHNSRLIEAEHRRRELERELEIAAQIQLSLLPANPLTVGPVAVAGVCEQAKNVGGDLFDYWHHGGSISLMVADVCGHDLGAALLAAAFHSALRSESAYGPPANLLERLNRSMFEDLNRSELLISVFYGEIDLDSMVFTYSSAGHPYPLLVRNNEVSRLEAGGTLLGVHEDQPFDEDRVVLRNGDALVLYTDGLVEAAAEDGSFFGFNGVCNAAVAFSNCQPPELAQSLVKSARDYLGDPVLKDDMTVLAARILDG